MSSESNPSAAAAAVVETKSTLTSARLECLLVVWRVREALQAMPQPADNLTIRRWNHGIARELWVAISAFGLAGALEMALSDDDGAAVMSSQPLTYLLRVAEWRNRRLRFSVLKVDIPTYLALSSMDLRVFYRMEDNTTFPHWWTWSTEGPGDGKRCPGWWANPSADVGAPMPVFEPDKEDLATMAGDMYLTLEGILAEKEAELRDIDDCIAEEELELSR
ncbi:hypothetical protein GSI_11216 [Ganoderma sinense ZZ0214-1]|uniref:Uncharacterized protein n=1 Tax=Ganoderma sinense ZZ0214-1 TaxID=1077348 RepID=A0A2G8RYT4_9APHY|nr:hypothetical protein GSI_11216 [Ganoderma sinense ZZ0214-1]